MATGTKFELKMGAATREAFGRTLVELGRANKDVVVCDADLSKSTMTTYFAQEFPERFFSCGIAEANMVAVGAGLASSGKIAFVSSFSAFLLNKGFEQLRVTAAYPEVNLKAVGTHSGISIGEDGPSQMSIEDLALACSLPGFAVLSPCDEVSMRAVIHTVAAHVGPVFVRAARAKSPIVYGADARFPIGGSHELIAGKDVTLIGHGLLVAEAIRAAGSSRLKASRPGSSTCTRSSRLTAMPSCEPPGKPEPSSSPRSTSPMAASGFASPRRRRKPPPASWSLSA